MVTIRLIDSKTKFPRVAVLVEVTRYPKDLKNDVLHEVYAAKIYVPGEPGEYGFGDVVEELKHVIELIFTALENGALTSGVVPKSFDATLGHDKDGTPGQLEVQLRKFNW
jgi:hypothetical protein